MVLTTMTYVVAGAVYSHGVGLRAHPSRPSSGDIPVHPDNHWSSDVIIDGFVMVSLTLFWCLLGLYARNLAQRLYRSARFLDMVRLHAKVKRPLCELSIP